MYNPVSTSEFKIPTPTLCLSRAYPANTDPYTVSAPDSGKKVHVFPSILSDEEVSTLLTTARELVLKKKSCQLIVHNPDASLIVQKILDKPDIRKLGLRYTDFVSVSYNNTSISIHVDIQNICPFTHKVLIYLNQLPENTGGTIFYTEDDVPFLITPNYEGSVVVFDSKLKHASQSFSNEYVKMSIGIRA